MTSATRLTEAEEIELEWESVWERIKDRMEASFCKIQREQEAKFDALKKAILDLSISSQGRSMETMDVNSSSYCNTDFEKLECNRSPVQKTEELELRQVDGPGSDNLKSQDEGTTATVEVDSEHAVCPIGENCDDNKGEFSTMEDDSLVEQLSGVVEEEIVNDGLVEQLSGVVEEISMILGKDFIGNSKELGNYRNFSLQCCLDARASVGQIYHDQVKKGMELEQNQLKGTERLSHARQNAPVNELTVGLPILNCYSLSLSWLLNWFPRPMVKLKFMIQNDEEMGSEGKVERASAKAEKDQIHVVVLGELGWLLDGDYDATGHDKISKEDNGELIEMRYGERGSGKTYGKRGTEGRGFVMANDGNMEKKVVAHVPMSSEHGWLASNWDPKPKVKMKLLAHHGEVIEDDLNSMVFPISKESKEAKKLMETECLAKACQNAQLRELATILSVIRNLKRLFVRFPKPMVKMKLELFSLRELLREADMLGVLRRKVACQGAHAWNLEQGLLVIELMTFNFSMMAIDHVNSAAKSNYMFSGLKWCCCWSRHCYAAWLVHIQV